MKTFVVIGGFVCMVTHNLLSLAVLVLLPWATWISWNNGETDWPWIIGALVMLAATKHSFGQISLAQRLNAEGFREEAEGEAFAGHFWTAALVGGAAYCLWRVVL